VLAEASKLSGHEVRLQNLNIACIGRVFRTLWLEVNIEVSATLRHRVLEYGNKSIYFLTGTDNN
jgi:hypothetical protein